MEKRNRYSRFNQNRKCHCCGKLTTDMAGEGTELCRVCYESAGMENQHVDTNGQHYGEKPADCPYCLGLQCMHEDTPALRKARKTIKAISSPENVKALNEAITGLVQDIKKARHILTAEERSRGGKARMKKEGK